MKMSVKYLTSVSPAQAVMDIFIRVSMWRNLRSVFRKHTHIHTLHRSWLSQLIGRHKSKQTTLFGGWSYCLLFVRTSNDRQHCCVCKQRKIYLMYDAPKQFHFVWNFFEHVNRAKRSSATYFYGGQRQIIAGQRSWESERESETTMILLWLRSHRTKFNRKTMKRYREIIMRKRENRTCSRSAAP